MNNKIHNCSNCGATINISDAKCPFCGYINEEGAEKEYMDRLYDLRNDLDVVDEKAAAEYGKGYKRILKIIIITIASLLLCSVILYLIFSAARNERLRPDPSNSTDMLEEMSWRREAFQEFDLLYEQEDYDKMCKAVFSAYEEDHNVFEWKHYWFASVYYDYILTKQDLERIDKNGWRKYDAESIFYRCCFCYYDEVYKNGKYGNKLTDDEMERLEPVIKEMNDILHERLGFTDEDMAGFKDTLIGEYDNLVYEQCAKIGREHMNQYK